MRTGRAGVTEVGYELHRVAGISAGLAPQLDLNARAARTALRKAVLAARNGDPR